MTLAPDLPEPRDDHVHRSLVFARDLIRATDGASGDGISIRVGLHCGPVIAGLVGRVRFVYDVWGETVNLSSRLEASGVPGRIHMSERARHLLADQLETEPEARIQELKGVGRIRTYLAD